MAYVRLSFDLSPFLNSSGVRCTSVQSAVVLLVVCLFLSACIPHSIPPEEPPRFVAGWQAEHRPPRYSFGVPVAGTTRNLWNKYHRLIAAVNSSVTGFAVRLESAQTRDRYALRLQSGMFDVALVDPHDVFGAERIDYSVFAKVGSKDRIGGVLVVRRDANISGISDLNGKKICFGSPANLAGTMMVRKLLHDSSPRYERTAKIMYTASEESALLQALWGLAHAAGTSRRGWEEFLSSHPGAADVLRPEWETNYVPGPAVMAHKRVPPEHVAQIAAALVNLGAIEYGGDAIAAAGFHDFTVAESGSYRDVKRFLNAYSRAFPRPRDTVVRQ